MPEAVSPVSVRGRYSLRTNFLVVLTSFCLFTLISWPNLLSFDLWIFKDRSSFLNLDYLVFTRHLRIGVDFYYSYGLLPVLLQHIALIPFGRGFRPLIGCTVLALIFYALFWALLLEHLPRQRRWLFAIVLLSPIVYSVNPNLPYALALLSMLFALLFVLREQMAAALAVSAVGCLCVPSLTLVLTCQLALYIVFDWWRRPRRTLSLLAGRLGPGLATYAALALLLGFVFGFASLAATALPLAGARHYRASGYGSPAAFLAFVHPEGYSTRYYIAYYIGSTVTWFVLCTLFVVGAAIFPIKAALRGKPVRPAGMVTVLVAILLIVFIFFAYGPRGEHAVYEGVLAAATLVALSAIAPPRRRTLAFLIFLGVGVLAEANGIYKSIAPWRTTAPGPKTLGLYAGAGIADNWSRVLELSRHHRTFLLAYATGQHIYYPTIEGPDTWFALPGLLFPRQESEILGQIRNADIVVEDLTSPPAATTRDIDRELSKMRVIHADGPFRILEH